MDIVWKGLVGGLMTALIAWLAKQGNVLPGILPLFPTLTLIALYIVGTKGDAGGFQQACAAALKTVPAYKLSADQVIKFLTTSKAYEAFVEYWNGKIKEG